MKVLIAFLIGIILIGAFISFADTWSDANYINRINRTTTLTTLTTNLTGFPFPIFRPDTTGFLSTCYDYQFYNDTSDGSYYHELDPSSCANGKPMWWINQNVNTVPFNSKDYFNYSSIAGDNSTYNVWDANFTLVYHFNESVGEGGTVRDSSRYGNNGTVQQKTATTWNSSYKMGNALMINNSGSKPIGVNTSDSASQSYSTQMTIEAWIRRYNVSSSANFEVIASKRPDATAGHREFEFTVSTNGDCTGGTSANGKLRFIIFSAAGGIGATSCGTTSITASGSLTYVVGVYNRTHLLTYTNGILEGVTAYSTAINDSTAILRIGNEDAIGNPFDNGNVIEEFRISNVARSSDWITATYWSVVNSSTITTFGTNETQIGSDTTAPTVVIQHPVNSTNSSLNYTLNFTATDTSGIDKCWWVNVTGNNNSLVSCNNITWLEGTDGYKNFTVYANDTVGNTGSLQRFWTLARIPTYSSNSTNVTYAGRNTSFNILFGINATSTMSQYNFTWCNGMYNSSQAKCGYAGAGASTFTMSEFQTIGASNGQPVESVKSFLMKTTDGTLWSPYYNQSDLKIYLRNSSNGITWNMIGVIDSAAMTEPKGEGHAINSTDFLLFSWCDNTHAYFKTYNTKTNTFGSRQTVRALTGATGCRTALAVNKTDAIFLASTENGGAIVTNISTTGGDTWATSSSISTVVLAHISINLYIDRFNNLHMLDGNKTGTKYSTDYYNSTPSGTTWGGYYQVAAPSNDQQSDMLVDFNGNRHIFYSYNVGCGADCQYNSHVYYINSTGFGSFTSAINITTNYTNGADTMWATQTNDSTIWLFYTDAYTASQNNWCQMLRASPTDMTNWNWTRIATGCRYPQPRGTTWPLSNSNDNNTVIDVLFANFTSPYNIHYFNVTIGSSQTITNTSWLSNGFTAFSTTNWVNVSKIVNSTVGSTIAYLWQANTSLKQSVETPVYYYTTDSSLSINYVSPTINTSTLLDANFTFINASISTSATECTLEWRQVSTTNESMTISADNTYCYINKTFSEGFTYFFKTFVNESIDSVVESERNFTSDMSAPSLVITSPTNTTYNTTNITFAFSTEDTTATTCVFQNNTINYTIPYCVGFTFLAKEGFNTVKMFVNDSLNHKTVGNRTFTVNITTYNSTIIFNLTSPIAKNYNVTTIEFNWSITNTLNNISSSSYTIDNDNNISSYHYCQQETVNVSTACGGLATGSYGFTDNYMISIYNAFDGNWSNYASDDEPLSASPFYINYTKPSNAVNTSLWEVKDYSYGDIGNSVNLTIPQSCWDFASTINFKVLQWSYAGATNWSCQNSTGWNILRSVRGAGYGAIWEEKMHWSFPDLLVANTTLTLSEGWHNITVFANDTTGYSNSTKVTFFIDSIIPTLANVSIYPSPANDTDNLTGNWTATGNSTANYNWFKNDISLDINMTTLTNGNFTVGDNITFSMQVSDNTTWTAWQNSSTLTIGDSTPPLIVLYTAIPSSLTLGNSILFNMTCTDSGTISSILTEIEDPAHLVLNYSMSPAGTDIYTRTYVPAVIGTYSIKGFCIDGSSNMAVSSNASFDVTAGTVSPGGGGSSITIIENNTVPLNDITLPGLDQSNVAKFSILLIALGIIYIIYQNGKNKSRKENWLGI